MNQPMVGCIMLTADRPAMAARAIKSFLAQTYERKRLYIWDTSTVLLDVDKALGGNGSAVNSISAPPVAREHFVGATIGKLRNAANKYAVHHYIKAGEQPEVLIHWDDDDYSHPRRIEEQVELLLAQSVGIPSMGKLGAQCVGYNDVLFWDTRHIGWPKGCPGAYADEELVEHPETWRYKSVDPRYVLGSSMCYWADAWRGDPFDDAPGEDLRWWRRHSARCVGVSSEYAICNTGENEPRLICSIHGRNTSPAYGDQDNKMWTRQHQYDAYMRERMAL